MRWLFGARNSSEAASPSRGGRGKVGNGLARPWQRAIGELWAAVRHHDRVLRDLEHRVALLERAINAERVRASRAKQKEPATEPPVAVAQPEQVPAAQSPQAHTETPTDLALRLMREGGYV